MALFDEIPSSRWQQILDDVSRRFDIHTTLSSDEGKVLLEGGRYNPLCAKIRATPQSLTAVCSQTSQAMTHEARAAAAPTTDLCEVGMYKTIVPICLSSARSRMVRKMLAIMVVPLEK